MKTDLVTMKNQNLPAKFEEHDEFFSNLYASGGWGPVSSGGGSSPENTVEYRKFLIKFINENKIKTVWDYGCGDWTFSKLIDWGKVQYTGIEVVKKLVDQLNIKYKKTNIKFFHITEKNSKNFYIKKGDLLILKDVLQHWNNEEIVFFLDKVIDNFKFIIINNSSSQKEDWEELNSRMGGRPLSCNYYPLKKYNIKKILNYGDKEISVIEREEVNESYEY
jgi:hypothetical protein